jgi:plasmid stabilization system protein ParE
MKPVTLHPDAEAEADRAFEWYWVRSESAAIGFDAAFRGAIATLRKSPQACSPFLKATRRIMLNRYPYFVVFRELPNAIQIVAVAHAKRRPGNWSSRMRA